MRKAGDKYYFIYSSWLNHELCYAISDYPDKDFAFGGTIVSNADIGYEGRKACDMLNMTGTTHGSMECIGGQWYIFYHRLTHKSDYSRQACSEKIAIEADGTIKQVEMTSCGLNDGPLVANGSYPAVIACNITNGRMPHGCNSIFKESFPNVTNIGEERFIGEIAERTLLGYKYFACENVQKIAVVTRRETEDNLAKYEGPLRVDVRNTEFVFEGHTIRKPGNASKESMLEIRLSETGEPIAMINLENMTDKWGRYSTAVAIPDGVYPIYFVYHGEKNMQLKEIEFI